MSAPSPSPPALVSIREFARLDGCDDKLVRRAIKAGKLPVSEDGKVDRSLAGSGWRKQNRRGGEAADTAQMSAPAVRTRDRAPKVSAPEAGDLATALAAIGDDEVGSFLANLLAGRFASTALAEQIKENGLAAKHLIAARKDAGDLVEVARAETLFFEAARSWRDAWMSFPTKIGPMLAADLDVDTDKVVEALTIHVQQQLEQLGEPTANFAAQE